jgi:CRP-like cAMP-binding protein
MISPELIRRYPFFAEFDMEQIVTLAKAGEEVAIEAGQFIFRQGDELDHFFLVVDGKVGILIDQSGGDVSYVNKMADTGGVIELGNVVSTAGPGEVFGWSGFVLPHTATSSAQAMTTSQLISFDCRELRREFEKDCRFAYLMMQKMAQVIRDRLRDLRVESLSALVLDKV